eukprot:gene17869-22804_t
MREWKKIRWLLFGRITVELGMVMAVLRLRKPKLPVYTYDLAATIAFALNIKQPYAWIGRPVKPVFEGFSEPENLYLGEKTVDQP